MQGRSSFVKAKQGTATSTPWVSRRFQNQRLKARKHSRQMTQAASADILQSLSTQLMAEIQVVPEKDRSGPPVAAVKDILDQMKQKADESGYCKAEPLSSICGKFKQLVSTFDYVDEDRTVTLGAITFQQIGPKDLKLYLVPSSGMGGLFQGVDAPDQYTVATPIKVAEGEHEGLIGISSVLGSFSIDEQKPHRQNIGFQGLKIEPADTSPDKLKAWLSLLKEHNPTMADDGTVVINFQQPIKGWRDFIHLDADVQITIGNRGGMVAVERTQ